MSFSLHAQDTWAELESGGGIAGHTQLATPFGMRGADRLRLGDCLRASVGGPVTVVSIRPAANLGWMRVPPMALGNRQALVVASGQSLLIESSYAARMVGSASVVVPALALRQWRGIAPCTTPAQAMRITLSRPALIFGSAGVMLAGNGPANHGLDTGNLPPVPSLSLGSALQLVACLIAYEAGLALGGFRPQAAAFAAPNRP